jgi:hypothetical protein
MPSWCGQGELNLLCPSSISYLYSKLGFYQPGTNHTPAVKKIAVPNYSNDQVMIGKPLNVYLE